MLVRKDLQKGLFSITCHVSCDINALLHLLYEMLSRFSLVTDMLIRVAFCFKGSERRRRNGK